MFKETIGLEIKARGSPILVLAVGEAFDVSPRRQEVAVPRKGERSTALFRVTPKSSAHGMERLLSEFRQGGRLLGVANTTLEISEGLARKVVVTISFQLRVHV